MYWMYACDRHHRIYSTFITLTLDIDTNTISRRKPKIKCNLSQNNNLKNKSTKQNKPNYIMCGSGTWPLITSDKKRYAFFSFCVLLWQNRLHSDWTFGWSEWCLLAMWIVKEVARDELPLSYTESTKHMAIRYYPSFSISASFFCSLSNSLHEYKCF